MVYNKPISNDAEVWFMEKERKCERQPITNKEMREIYTSIIQKDDREYAFVEMNIKQFRYINIQYGEEFGDKVLTRTLEILQEYIKERGFVARRYAATFDFFILHDHQQHVLDSFLMDIIDALFENGMEHMHKNYYASFGIYLLDHKEYPTYGVLQTYAGIARTQNRNVQEKRTFSYEIAQENILKAYLHDYRLSMKLTKARFQEEFQIYIQPKVELKTHRVCGGEMLVRWITKDGTMVPLNEFMDTFTKNGDLYIIDIQNFDKMCQFLQKRLKQQQAVVPISFNVTNLSVFDEDFIEDYLGTCRKYQLPKDLIEFEFTEDIHFEKEDEVQNIIDIFRSEGFVCSLDDFGNGFSSFNLLMNSAIDIIKLDRLFFQGMLSEQRKRVIHNVMDIAKIKGIKVLAEGIETKEYAEFVEAEGCDYIQGFYYYRPMPLAEFEKLLDSDVILPY